MRYLTACFLGTLLCALTAVTAWASPLTGDRGIGAWIALLVVALIVLIGVLVALIKKNRNDR